MGEQAAECPLSPHPRPYRRHHMLYARVSRYFSPHKLCPSPASVLLSLRLVCSGSMILRRKEKEERCPHTLEPGLGQLDRKFRGIEREAVTGSSWAHFLGLKDSSLHGRGVAKDGQEPSPLRGAQGWSLSSGSGRTQS